MAKQIFGQVGKLRPEMVARYTALHQNPWPEVLHTIQACHLHNYSIFLHGQLVFACFEYTGDDYEADMAKMAADPKTREWWTHTHPCFEPYGIHPDSEFYADMQPIFHTP